MAKSNRLGAGCGSGEATRQPVQWCRGPVYKEADVETVSNEGEELETTMRILTVLAIRCETCLSSDERVEMSSSPVCG